MKAAIKSARKSARESDENMAGQPDMKPARQAKKRLRMIEAGIITLCILVLLAIFQPFSHGISQIGLGSVIFCGLIFNLVGLIDTARQPRDLIKPTVIIAVTFFTITALAIVTAILFGKLG